MRVRHCPFKKRYRRNRRPTAPQRPGTRKDPTGSDLWPDGACCTVMMAIRSSRGRAIPAFSRLPKKQRTPNCHTDASQRPGTRKDPPESNLCSGGSCCIAMLSNRDNVQTRAALKRRGVGLRARSGVEAAQRPGCVRGAVWRPHSGRVACAERSGSRTAAGLRARSGEEAGTARCVAAIGGQPPRSARVHGKT